MQAQPLDCTMLQISLQVLRESPRVTAVPEAESYGCFPFPLAGRAGGRHWRPRRSNFLHHGKASGCAISSFACQSLQAGCRDIAQNLCVFLSQKVSAWTLLGRSWT